MSITVWQPPPLPDEPDLVTSEAALAIERRVAESITQLEDVDLAREWLAKADALTAYLRHKEAEGPMLGAMRRIEARIGELLGEAPGRGKSEMNPHAESFHFERRREFRALAYAVERGVLDYLDDGEDSPWRSTRRALLLHELLRNMGGLKSSTSVEWYTPATYIEASREVLGGIDLDPASNEVANETVKATRFFSRLDDGLLQEWHGRVFCNPPYGAGTGMFAAKLVEEYEAKRTTAAVLLINAYGFDTTWFQPLWDHTLCFTDHRISFYSPQRKSGGAANGNIFAYLGPEPKRFADTFGQFGHIVRTWP